MPKWIKNDNDWQEFVDKHAALGISLEKSRMVKNNGRKQLAKLMLNSLWGKFAQRPNFVQNKTCRTAKDYRNLEDKWDDNEIDIVWRHEGVPNANGDRQCIALYRKIVLDEDLDSQKNIAIAAFVTAHARLRLWTEMNKLGKRVVYHDTDSIIYERDPDGYNIPNGRYLGEWEDECGQKPITGFVSTGPKTYAYRYLGDKEEATVAKITGFNNTGVEYQLNDDKTVQQLVYQCKAKGFTLNHETSQQINFHGMHSLIIQEKDYLEAIAPIFQYDRVTGMVTYNATKRLEWSYDKGSVMEDFSVMPKGFELFAGEHGNLLKRGRGDDELSELSEEGISV